MQREVPVLIVGGGGCGLMSSICLTDAGVRSLLVERHPEPARAPKAHLLNSRTMEIFRQHGFADEIYARGMPMEENYVRWMTSLRPDPADPLMGREIFRMDAFGGASLREGTRRLTPCLQTNYPQLRLEPFMRDEARARPEAEVLYNHELVRFEQDADGVTAEILDRGTNETHTVRAAYMIGADGGKTVGDMLGISLEGPQRMMEMITLHFSADLSEWIPEPAPMINWFINPNRAGMWASGALVPLGPTWGRHSEEYYLIRAAPVDDPRRHEDEASVEHLRQLLNIPGLEVTEVHRVSHWVLDAIVADRYHVGRVFLAGDAVHRHPPTTGLGLNTAVGDAHALAWRLKAVLAGEAGEELLETYGTERRPVGLRNRDWALAAWFQHPVGDLQLGLFPGQNVEQRRAAFDALFAETPDGETRRAKLRAVLDVQRIEFKSVDVEMGYAYEEGALVPDGSPPRKRDPWGADYQPNTRPGERLPHAWVRRDGNRLSTLDLVTPGRFLLLAGPGGDAWVGGARAVSDALGVPIDAVAFGERNGTVQLDGGALLGLSDDGAILVRPDQHVAWREGAVSGRDATSILGEAVARILSREAGSPAAQADLADRQVAPL